MRMASIVTGEDTTELLILAREDYNNLVFLTMQGDSAHKLKLLRKTELFRTVDGVHLQALSKFMEPRKYQIDEQLVSAGKRASEIIIVETGECRAITEITEGFERISEEEKQNMAYNRLMEAPHRATPVAVATTGTEFNHVLNKSKQSKEMPDVLKTSIKEVKQKQLSVPQLDKLASQLDAPLGPLTPQRKLNRLATKHLTTTKKKVIDLGRIAPNSVLASYIALLSDVHEDVYHPETVVASSLVTAYTIGKHDLLTHLAKDSYIAIAKTVQDHKQPVLNFLWENVPRMLDENQWRMEKTWEKFRTQVANDHHKDINILTTLKQLNRMHISQTSGNDHLMRIVSQAPHGKTKEGEDHTPDPQAKVNVTKDWGLPGSSSSLTMNRKFARGEDASGLSGGLNTSSWVSTNSGHQVSTAIRQRLNQSHTATDMLEMSAVNSLRRSSTDIPSLDGRPKTPQTPKGKHGESLGSLKANAKADSAAQMPFTLVQIHREFSRANPTGLTEQGRRHVRSYIRLCGSFYTCAKAKELGDTQMEQIYLTLFHSEASKEKELLLNWTPFRGFEGMSVQDTDIFIIYCRSAPLEFASINPSKNIFNMNFPAICKPQNQRFAVIVSNKLKSANDDSPKDDEDDDDERTPTATTPSLKRDNTSATGFSADDDDEEAAGADKFNSKGRSLKGIAIGNSGSAFTAKGQRKVSVAGSSIHDSVHDVSVDSIPSPASNIFEHNLRATATPAANSSTATPLYSHHKSTPWPMYLMECSVLYEVLMTTPSRLDGLKYAMNRFGAMSDENLQENNSRSVSRRKARNNVFESDSKVVPRIGTGFTQKIFLKAFNNRVPDRVLKIVLHEHKLICVMPLFKWILINSETFETLDFTRSFSESNVRKIFNAEAIHHGGQEEELDPLDESFGEEDDFAGDEHGHNVNNYRDLNVEFHEKQLNKTLVKSFSEAGMLSTYRPKQDQQDALQSRSAATLASSGLINDDFDDNTLGHNSNILTNSMVDGRASEFSAEQITHAQALQLFEREITSKEIAKQVNVISQTSNWLNNSCSLYGDDIVQEPAPLSEEQKPAADLRSGATNPHGHVARKLGTLSASIQSRSKILQEHDALYDQEHETHLSTRINRSKPLHSDQTDDDVGIPGRLKRPPPKSNVSKNRTRDQEMGLIRRRLEVIESLQEMGNTSLLGVNKSPFAVIGRKNHRSVVEDEEEDRFKSVQSLVYSNNRATTPTQNEGMLSHPSNKYLSPQKRQQLLAATSGPAGSAGKRVAESLRVLADSLDQQYLHYESSAIRK